MCKYPHLALRVQHPNSSERQQNERNRMQLFIDIGHTTYACSYAHATQMEQVDCALACTIRDRADYVA